jgi:hypothetical protein
MVALQENPCMEVEMSASWVDNHIFSLKFQAKLNKNKAAVAAATAASGG